MCEYYAILLYVYRKIMELFEIVKFTCVDRIQIRSNQWQKTNIFSFCL